LKTKAILINHYVLFVSTHATESCSNYSQRGCFESNVRWLALVLGFFIFFPKPEHSKSIVDNCIPPRTKTNVLVENATTLANSWLN